MYADSPVKPEVREFVYTQQELFDKVAKHLLTQNARSTEDMKCAYRGAKRRMCAAGVLLPDNLNYVVYNHWNWAQLVSAVPALMSLVDDHKLVLELQLVHDQRTPEYWSGELAAVAERWGLEYAPTP